jgi:hypothetical protein
MTTNIASSTAKRQSLVGLILSVIGAVLVGLSTAGEGAVKLVGAVAGALLFGAGLLVAVRIHCPNCGRRLSSMFPGGSLLLLWAAKQRCRGCDKWV